VKIAFRRPRKLRPQAEAFDDDTSLYNMLSGGYGAGKTAFVMYKALKLSWQNAGVPGGILAPSLPEFKRDLLPMMLETIQAEIPGARYYVSGRFGMHFRMPWSSQPIYVFTAERPIKGPNLGWGVVNEFSLMKWDTVRDFIARIRRKDAKVRQIAFGGTPEDEFLWLADFIEKNEREGLLKVRTASSLDNPFNHPDYGRDLLANLDEETAKVFVYGLHQRIGGNWFFYAYDPKVNDHPVERIPGETVHACVDFNVGKMSASFCNVVGEGKSKQARWFDELRLTSVDADTKALGKAIIARYGKDDVLVTCDASGKARKTSGLSDVKELRALGLKVRFKTSNPRIRKSQLQCNGLLATRRAILNPLKCKLLKRDLQKVKQLLDFQQDKSEPELTHMSDGFRYLLDQEFPDWLERGAKARYTVRGA
jgi:hypothetical protein